MKGSKTVREVSLDVKKKSVYSSNMRDILLKFTTPSNNHLTPRREVTEQKMSTSLRRTNEEEDVGEEIKPAIVRHLNMLRSSPPSEKQKKEESKISNYEEK